MTPINDSESWDNEYINSESMKEYIIANDTSENPTNNHLSNEGIRGSTENQFMPTSQRKTLYEFADEDKYRQGRSGPRTVRDNETITGTK